MIAICIGHSRSVSNGTLDGGAISVGGVNEWYYNKVLAAHIREILLHEGYESVIIDAYDGAGYGSAMRWLAARIRALAATLAVELHFNSADDPKACGHEMLYWHESIRAARLANDIEIEFNLRVPEIKARGAKAKFNGDRGAEFLRLTHCPAVIVETGFGSNAGDWQVMTTRKQAIAEAIAEGILTYLE